MSINPSSPEQLKSYEKFLSPALLTNTKYQKSAKSTAKGHVSGEKRKSTDKTKERMEKGVGQIFSNLGLKVQAGFARLQHLIFTHKKGDPLWMNNAAILKILNNELKAINDLDTTDSHSDSLKTNVENALKKLEIIDQLNKKYIKGHTKAEDRLKKLKPKTARDDKALPAKTIKDLKKELTQVKEGLEAPKSVVAEQPAVFSEEPSLVVQPVASHSDSEDNQFADLKQLTIPNVSSPKEIADKQPVKEVVSQLVISKTGSRLSNVGSASTPTAQGANKAVDKTQSRVAATAKKTNETAHFTYSKTPTKKTLFFGVLAVALGLAVKEVASKVEIEKIDLDTLMQNTHDFLILPKPKHKTLPQHNAPPEPIISGFSGEFPSPKPTLNESGTAQAYPLRFVTLEDLKYAIIAAQEYLATTILPNTQGESNNSTTDNSVKADYNQNGDLTFFFNSLNDVAFTLFSEIKTYLETTKNVEPGISNTDVKGQDKTESSVSFDENGFKVTISNNDAPGLLEHLQQVAKTNREVANTLVKAAYAFSKQEEPQQPEAPSGTSPSRLMPSSDNAVALRETPSKHETSSAIKPQGTSVNPNRSSPARLSSGEHNALIIPKAFEVISFGICEAPSKVWSNELQPLSTPTPIVTVENGTDSITITVMPKETSGNNTNKYEAVIRDLGNVKDAIVHKNADNRSVNITIPKTVVNKAPEEGVRTNTPIDPNILRILSGFPAEDNVCIASQEAVQEAVAILKVGALALISAAITYKAFKSESSSKPQDPKNIVPAPPPTVKTEAKGEEPMERVPLTAAIPSQVATENTVTQGSNQSLRTSLLINFFQSKNLQINLDEVNSDELINFLNNLYGNEDWKKDKEVLILAITHSNKMTVSALLRADATFHTDSILKLVDSFYDNIPWMSIYDDFFIQEVLLSGKKEAIELIMRENTCMDYSPVWTNVLGRKRELLGILPEKLKKNDKFWMRVLTSNHTLAEILPEEFSDNRNFWIEALMNNSQFFWTRSENNKISDLSERVPEKFNNHDFWIEMLKNGIKVTALPQNILNDFHFWNNPKIWEGSLKQNIQILEQIPISTRKNPDCNADSLIKIKTLIYFFRKKKFNKLIKNIDPQKVELLKKTEFLVSISKAVREPLEDLEKDKEWFSKDQSEISQAQQAVTTSAKLGSYSKFKQALRSSFIDTLQGIYASKEEYIIIVDDVKWGKSSTWMVPHLYDLMSIYPPKQIVSKDGLKAYLDQNPGIKHIVMVDDAVYSGNQLYTYITDHTQNVLKKDHHLHVTVPYMTTYGKGKINKALWPLKCEYKIHSAQKMLTYDELFSEWKIFSLTGKVIVNYEKLNEIQGLKKPGNLSVINQKLIDFVKEKPDPSQIMNMISFIDSQLLELKKLGEEELNAGLSLIRALFKTMTLERDQARHEKLQQAYLNNWQDNRRPPRKKTPSWFAHKGADNLSTNHFEMKRIAQGKRPPEPYKSDKSGDRIQQIKTIKNRMGDRTLEKTVVSQSGYEWLKDRVDFVQTNRGFFLLGNSYIKDTNDSSIALYIINTNDPSLALSVKDKKILLGGKEGEYQYKLKEGDVFVLEDPETNKRATLKLASGKLQVVT